MENQVENKIFEGVKRLNNAQRSNVLDYIESFPKQGHSTQRYKRKALKQIRRALQEV